MMSEGYDSNKLSEAFSSWLYSIAGSQFTPVSIHIRLDTTVSENVKVKPNSLKTARHAFDAVFCLTHF